VTGRAAAAVLFPLALGATLAPQRSTLAAALDEIFASPALSRALVAARVESLGARGSTADARVLYTRNADRLVIPASNMKLVTIAAAAATLGWDYRFETRVESAGAVSDGVLDGDLVVTGTGDPTIASPDGGDAPLFLAWADRLLQAGIRRINGRIVADDDAFEDEEIGAGWAWDYLAAGYAAPVGALNYNDNVSVARFMPGTGAGTPVTSSFGPPGHGLDLTTDVTTGPAGSSADLELVRPPNTTKLTIRGRVPAGGAAVTRSAAVENPTLYFAEGLRLALASRGIRTSGGAWDIDDVTARPPADGRRTILLHQSPPLSVVAGPAMKASTNLYGEVLVRALGRTRELPGSVQRGRAVIQDVLNRWSVPPDAVVIYDGSGLSRYNYLTADAIVAVLKEAWRDERLRGPFLALLPVAGRDGTLELRMRGTALAGRVQAKTGTISNVRALSGFLDRPSGEKLVFSIVVNHYTAPNATIDDIVERALERVLMD
jgi:D-alanyl-D-alanine carboxypeptidase/D-alanyl-D-alanine-endopeptidase (penicillin-binding protein 4)